MLSVAGVTHCLLPVWHSPHTGPTQPFRVTAWALATGTGLLRESLSCPQHTQPPASVLLDTEAKLGHLAGMVLGGLSLLSPRAGILAFRTLEKAKTRSSGGAS